MSTEMHLLRSADPAAGPMPTHTKHELLRSLATAHIRTQHRSKRRLAIIGTVAGAVLASTGGLAVALWTQAPTTALKVNCAAGVDKTEYDRDGGFTSVIDTVTGDALTDCASRYAALGQVVPQLRAYDVGAPYLIVLPSDWTAPDGGRALPSDFRADTGRLVLKQRLEDPVDGPSATCQTNSAVANQVQSYWEELGLTGWTTKPAPGAEQADGATRCAFALLDERGQPTVYIQTGTPLPAPGDSPEEQAYVALKQKLRTEVADPCLTLADAMSAARAALDATGVAGVVTTRPGGQQACTAVDLTGFGPVYIILS